MYNKWAKTLQAPVQSHLQKLKGPAAELGGRSPRPLEIWVPIQWQLCGSGLTFNLQYERGSWRAIASLDNFFFTRPPSPFHLFPLIWPLCKSTLNMLKTRIKRTCIIQGGPHPSFFWPALPVGLLFPRGSNLPNPAYFFYNGVAR